MWIYRVIILGGVWSLYNFSTLFVQGLPFLRLVSGDAALRALNAAALGWSPVIGALQVVAGVIGEFFCDLGRLRVVMLAVTVAVSVAYIL